MWQELKRIWRDELFQTITVIVMSPLVGLCLVFVVLAELCRTLCDLAMCVSEGADRRRVNRREMQQDG